MQGEGLLIPGVGDVWSKEFGVIIIGTIEKVESQSINE